MLLTRDQIRQDKSFDQLTDAILERDQPRTTDLFFRMVARDGRSMSDALSLVTAAEAPFVQVPSHINVRDGQITLVNNDHTILGLRTSMSLAPHVPAEYRLLPMLQSVWYIPAGLDIWNQLLGKYPGRYATMKGMNVPPPSYGPALWNPDQPPIMQEGAQPEDHALHLRGVRAQLNASSGSSAARDGAAARRLAEDAGRARLLRPLHERLAELVDIFGAISSAKRRIERRASSVERPGSAINSNTRS